MGEREGGREGEGSERGKRGSKRKSGQRKERREAGNGCITVEQSIIVVRKPVLNVHSV